MSGNATRRGTIASTSFNPARKYRPYFEVARRAGVDVAQCLELVGLSEPEALDPGTQIPRDRAIGLCAELIQRAGDPEFGLRAAECTNARDTDLFYLTRYAANLRESSALLARYFRLNGDAIECAVSDDGRHTVLTAGLAGDRVLLPETADWTFGAMVLWTRVWTAGRALPLRVELPRPKPRDPDRYRRFFGAPVEFDAERGALHYATADAHVPFVDRDPRLLSLLLGQADELLEQQTCGASLPERIAAILGRDLERGQLSMPALARHLAMSERTLRRRLQQLGFSYHDILECVRRERALALARDRRASVASVAHRVGFTDLTAFARAFRRWTGENPSEYLRRQRE